MSMKRWRAGRGALVILALLLASSGALKLGSGVGAALALVPETPEATAADAGPMVCPEPPVAVAEALKTRAEMLDAQELALKDRLAALDLAEQAIDQRMTRLAEAEAELSETLARSDGAAESDLTKLTAVYETMKPKDAAALFGAMAPEFAAGFLGRMRPDAAAAILSGMSSEAAYGVSVLLAGRNALVPKE